MKKGIIGIIIIFLAATACRKDSYIGGSNARLGLSADTLHFDTLFTSTGSTTQLVKIYNLNNQKLRISRIRLAGGNKSYFRINADGTPGPDVTGLEMEANDSLYVFVTVSIDPHLTDLPFLVTDSIFITYNGNEQVIQLDAWGQNANFFRGKIVSGNETWTNNRPYVILDSLVVAPGGKLTLDKGCRIYVHANAPVFIDGTLEAHGELYDSTRIRFRGDRLDDPYREFPASWPGIIFRPGSHDNDLQYVDILNAYQGIVVGGPSPNGNPGLKLRECIIDNCYDAGLFGLQADIEAENCLFSNNGKNLVLAYGGNYQFNHCTDVAYSNSYLLHKEPVLLLTDYIKDGNTVYTADLNAQFTNCIFWGDNGTVDDEVVTARQGSGQFTAVFENCLWKSATAPEFVTANNVIANMDPLFDSVNTQKRYFDFHLQTQSPALNSGMASSTNHDLDGNPRPVGLPDMGCYEKQ